MMKMMRTAPLVLLVATSSACIAETIDHVDPRLTPVERSFPQDLATAYCEAVFACEAIDGCEAIVEYATVGACIDGESTKLAEVQSKAVDAGLIFDADCVQSTIATYTSYGCMGLMPLGLSPDARSEWLCPPYHGTLEDDQPCENVWPTQLSECGAGAICYDDCTAIEAAVCACEAGFACAPNSGGQCLPIVADGEVCFTESAVAACGQASRCAPPSPLPPEGDPVQWRCEPRVALGEQCVAHDQCQSGACENAVCVPATPALCEPALAPGKWL